MILLDTNVISESLKPFPSITVAEWFGDRGNAGVFTTSITVAEISYGLELLPKGKRRVALANAIEKLFTEVFPNRVLHFDELAARAYGHIAAGRSACGRPISQSDAMIAAIAKINGMTLATRNTDDFEGCGIELLNPWIRT